jgi:hypothetical protein
MNKLAYTSQLLLQIIFQCNKWNSFEISINKNKFQQ